MATNRYLAAMMPNQRVCVLGLGYIGLPTAAVLASRGYRIEGVDVNTEVVEVVNSGDTHIVEPELDILVRGAVGSGALMARTAPSEADVFMICVPTPLGPGNVPDVSYVERAAESICGVVRAGNLVILESTSPPGTTARVAAIIAERSGIAPPALRVAHAPERVLPGQILREVVENDRIVGGVDETSTRAAADFYGTFVSGELLLTDARTAETAKLVENAYRDVNIAFANELSLMAERIDLDVWELIRLANHHPRVNILMPGPGVGGHCIAVDPWFLVHGAPEVTRLIRTAREVNEGKPAWVVEKIRAAAAGLERPRIACLGLAYKPDIDDLRESPAVTVVRALAAADFAVLRVVEPNLRAHAEFALVELDDAVRDADIVVFLVGHREFRELAARDLEGRIVVDACGARQSG